MSQSVVNHFSHTSNSVLVSYLASACLCHSVPSLSLARLLKLYQWLKYEPLNMMQGAKPMLLEK